MNSKILELRELFKEIPAEELGSVFGRSLLSDTAILRHMEKGNIVIDPFKRENLGTCSYDVALGPWFWREQSPDGGYTTYSPYSEEDIRRVWGPKANYAQPARLWIEKHGPLKGIDPDDLVVWVIQGETILCHTEEFIGGRGGIVTTMMKARSSLGRNFIEICKCAGWGDVGYVNRWTMEVTNNSRYYQIPLVVGRRVAQLAFFEVEMIQDQRLDYIVSGKYQEDADIKELKKKWSPEMMLPKMYLDREVKKS